MEFLLPLLIRIASGVQNALGYAKLNRWRTVFSFVLIGIAGSAMLGFVLHQDINYGQQTLAFVALVFTLVAIGGVEDSFDQKYNWLPTDIHLYETIFGYCLPLTFILGGGNIIWVVASTYPALILHKMAINMASGKPWYYEGTDDPTGKTFNIPLLNIKIPRLGIRWRIGFAVASIMLFVLSWDLGWELRIWPLYFKM